MNFARRRAEKAAIIRLLVQLRQEVDYLKQVIGSVPPQNLQQIPNAETTYETPREDPEEQELDDIQEEYLSLKTLSQELIEKVLRKHGGNRKEAAKELGISERTLYRKLKK